MSAQSVNYMDNIINSSRGKVSPLGKLSSP